MHEPSPESFFGLGPQIPPPVLGGIFVCGESFPPLTFFTLSRTLYFTMATLILDTHNFISRLIAAGLAEKEAEAIVEGIKEINFENVASKGDVRLAIAELKADFFKWLVPLLIGQIAVFAAVVKFMS